MDILSNIHNLFIYSFIYFLHVFHSRFLFVSNSHFYIYTQSSKEIKIALVTHADNYFEITWIRILISKKRRGIKSSQGFQFQFWKMIQVPSLIIRSKEICLENLHTTNTKSIFIISHFLIVLAAAGPDLTKSFRLRSVTICYTLGVRDPGSDSSGGLIHASSDWSYTDNESQIEIRRSTLPCGNIYQCLR